MVRKKKKEKSNIIKPGSGERMTTKERRVKVLKWLRKGYTPNWCINKLVDEDELALTSAKSFVYGITAELNKSNTELMEEAKNYIINSLLGVIEECSDINDVKTKLMALKQLSDVTKVTESKAEIKVNFGFDYNA